jgi:adenylate cyclase
MSIGGDELSGPSSAAAKAAANKAISLDPGLAGPHTALGFEKFMYEWDWKGAEEEYRLALAIDPSNTDVHRRYAHLLSNTGRHAEAVRETEEALRRDPLSFLGNALGGQFLLQAGQVDAAIAAEKRALQIDPDFWIAHVQLGKAYVAKGMNAEALEEYRASWAHSKGSTEPLGRTGHLLAKTGREREARKILADLMAMSKERYVPPYNIAMVHAGLGDKAEAVRWLRRGCTDRDARMVFLKVEPIWTALHGEPGFADVERCVNLP